MESKKINLGEIRTKLIQLEDLIIVSLFDRVQYKLNQKIYVPGGVSVPDSKISFFDFLFQGTERLHASAGRYLDHEERPFFNDTPLDSLAVREVIPTGVQRELDYTGRIRDLYFKNLSKFILFNP